MKLSEEAGPGWILKALGCGALVVVALYGLGILIGGAFGPLQKIAQSQSCQSNLIRLTQGSMIYSEDYDQRLPPASGWMDRIGAYVTDERYYHCPAVSRPDGSIYGYAMDRALDARPLERIVDRPTTSLLFDSTDMARSATGRSDVLLPKPGRHVTRARKDEPSKSGNFIGYADGNVRIKLDAGQ